MKMPPKYDRDAHIKELEKRVDELFRRMVELETGEDATNIGIDILSTLSGVRDEFREELIERIKAVENGE